MAALPGWSQVPGNRNRMVSPSGEVVSYYQYRNTRSQQEFGAKSYHHERKAREEVRYKLNDAKLKGKIEKGAVPKPNSKAYKALVKAQVAGTRQKGKLTPFQWDDFAYDVDEDLLEELFGEYLY